MGIINKTIGTNARDYATVTLWEADLDNAGIYSAGDDAIGTGYNDSVFDEDIQIDNGGTVGLNSILLTVAEADRHDGTAGSGCRVTRTAGSAAVMTSRPNTSKCPIIVEWWEFDGGKTIFRDKVINLYAKTGKPATVRNCIIHGVERSVAFSGTGISTSWYDSNIYDNIIYDIVSKSATGTASGINTGSAGAPIVNIYNNTIYSISNTTTGEAYGIDSADQAAYTVKNNICMDVTTVGGTAKCFLQNAPANATMDYNMASDATASGVNSLNSKTTTDQFVSIVAGSENLHLKGGADAIDVGVQITTPAAVRVDINGRDRVSELDTWDIGAHEYVAPPVVVSSDEEDVVALQGGVPMLIGII